MNLTYSLEFSNRKQRINLRNSPKIEISIQYNWHSDYTLYFTSNETVQWCLTHLSKDFYNMKMSLIN